MKQLLFITFIFIPLSFFAQSETALTPKIAFKIDKGESVKLHDMTIKFADVIEDSRCPKYTNCIWAGRAIVQLEITDKAGKLQDKTIILGETKGDESADKTLYRTNEYVIEAVGLNPYPEDGKETTPYTLLVSQRK